MPLSNAFEAAVERLFADPNRGTDAVYQPADGSPAVPVRVVFGDPSQRAPGLGQAAALLREPVAEVSQSEVPTKPLRNSLLTVSSTTWKIVEVYPDGMGLRWKMILGG